MGKIVKAVAVVGLAIGIAVAAPYLAGFIAAQGTLAFSAAAAAIGVGLSTAAAVLTRALTAAPSTTRSFFPGSARPSITADTTSPRSPGRWHDPIFMPWWRFAIEATTGDCMKPTIVDRWAIVDRFAPIRTGDLILIRVADQRRYYWGGWKLTTWDAWRRLLWTIGRPPMGKSFLGLATETLAFECHNPRTYMEVPLAEIEVLYRVRATATSLWAAIVTWRAVRASPNDYDCRLTSAVHRPSQSRSIRNEHGTA